MIGTPVETNEVGQVKVRIPILVITGEEQEVPIYDRLHDRVHEDKRLLITNLTLTMSHDTTCVSLTHVTCRNITDADEHWPRTVWPIHVGRLPNMGIQKATIP